MRRTFVSIVSLAALLLTAGTSGRADAPLLNPGEPAPDFVAQGWGGKSMHLSDLKGKTVVLDFWATWCGPCNQAMPHLQEIHQEYKDRGVVVLAICVSDTGAAADTWIKAHSAYKFSFALDPAERGPSTISDHYRVTAIPTTYVIDKDGVIVADAVTMSKEEIEGALESVLPPKPGAPPPAAPAPDPDETKVNAALQTGEISLHGVVGKDPSDASFTFSATSATSFAGKTEKFSKPRVKKVLLDSAKIIASDGDVKISEIASGVKVDVVGKDSSKGFKARYVKIVE